MDKPILFPARPSVMGVINCTPDSFYPGSRSPGTEQAVETARRMIDEGADILDLGGESSRPGSSYVEAEEEIRRVVPAVEGIRRFSDIPVSVDTRKAETARRALNAGADIINDISALRDDPGLSVLAAERGAPVILMHMRGTPETMQRNPRYEDPVPEIRKELGEWARRAREAGLRKEQIILDPGIGFGKTDEANLAILRQAAEFKEDGYPLLIGLSRKSFIGRILDGRPPEGRQAGTLAANAAAALGGADILRVHDVRETVDMIRVMGAIFWNN